ncbi:two-component sensor histidine kinase [Desulfosarcina sp. OttesenSCG-928-B08]|nr:two-component sensor histidine kinase [Desulfosarcina sp. OttesenSCG-928-B08]
MPGFSGVEKAGPDALIRKLNWLVFLRFFFALVLAGSTLTYQVTNNLEPRAAPIVLLYGVSGLIVVLSVLYIGILRIIRRFRWLFVFVQIVIDILCVDLIVYVTGGSASIFTFLYLLVVIYSSVFVSRGGTLWVAGICTVFFAALLILEWRDVIDPFGPDGQIGRFRLAGLQVAQKCAVLGAACFSVAFLSGYLSDQERRSKAELVVMETHLKRVQNLAQIGEMAAGLAHEIKNPLASLSGAIQMLKSDLGENNDHGRLMQIILRETDRLGNLVNNFLNFARPSAGKIQSLNIGQTLSEIVALFEKSDKVNKRVHPGLTLISNATIDMDPLHFHQVIWNLLLNAAESIEDEGRITIIVRQVRADQILIEIADTGSGMEESQIQRIFNPFYTTKPTGTGLGLSIVYRILETYDCHADVKSKPGSGTVFRLYFKPSSRIV